ncbi:MAG: DsbA family protein [Bryobacteraceae bacterium]
MRATMKSAGPSLTLPVSDRDHILGPANAEITLVEYGDFECPHCGRAYPVVEELRELLGNRMRFVYRHFPLTEAHEHAEMAAEAAEAAGEQNRFWEMHRALFTHQDSLDRTHLARYALSIGLDTARFAHAISERAFAKRIREDFMSGVRSGVNGTPTFFINGLRYDGPAELRFMADAIEQVLGARVS